VRFDAAITVNYETLNWQQAEIFTRWLAFLEMRGGMHDIPRTQLNGLTCNLTAQLPKQPIALPKVVEHYDEYEEDPLVRQWQRLGEGVDRVNQLLGRTEQVIKHTINAGQRQQLVQSAKHTVESVSHTLSELVETIPLPQITPLTPQPQGHTIRPPSSKGDHRER
jgi:hypothetical protein